ncbi:hypothetical protein Drose_04020 [Dactylosporangium roseum]|uniref:Uncharacterized protein n=1 Tax=Dactylosporangium roseum TaxID=47989 RepID=A0ABY5Z8W9_9ACTN|nr:hypothetical protein [Dactylosporangium roseum]UWZ37455.1 hypothetical protein Drose_04020 [Dactylosporangium roseum]
MFAVVAVAALELGGIVLSVIADQRRRLGERAIAARLLSAAVACFAVGLNWFGHGEKLAAGFFAGFSALGYLVWLIQSGNRRRDQLRATGMLPPVPPAYPVGHWMRNPWITSRARQLALADTSLGLYPSLDLARDQLRTEQRERAIAEVLRKELAKSGDRLAAKIAVTTYDLDQVAARLRDQADYSGLTSLVAARLDPTRLLNQQPAVGLALPAAPTTQPEIPVDQPSTEPEPTTQPEVAQPRVEQPAVAEPSNRGSSNRHRLEVVGERAAVRNARVLREIYPTGLPEVERQIRDRTGWSKVRVEAAVAAYLAGEDLPAESGGDADDADPELAATA